MSRVDTAEWVTKYVPPALVPMIDALQEPQRWQPEIPLNEQDVADWKKFLSTDLGRKLDVIMYNLAQQQLHRAAFGPNADVQMLVKFYAGYKAGWEAVKTLSLLDVRQNVESEQAGQGTANLDHLRP